MDTPSTPQPHSSQPAGPAGPANPSRNAIGTSPDMFERVIRALNVAYWEWTPGEDRIRVSTALAEMMDFDPESWTIQRMYDWMYPEDVPLYRAGLVAFFKSAADRCEFTYRYLRRGGGIHWARQHNLVERNAAGRVRRMTGTVSDITELKQREVENRALIARQEASIEVLRAISASPDDTQPVFDLIARHARELCHAATVAVLEYDGALLHMRSVVGFDPVATARFRQSYPRSPGPESISGRVVLGGESVHIPDAASESGLLQFLRELGSKAAFGLPLLRDGQIIGVIVLARLDTGIFSDGEIALVRSFAEQAVIAVASAATLRELKESLEQQTATSEVLQAINASPGDLTPVFSVMLRKAMQLCEAAFGELNTFDRAGFTCTAVHGAPAEYIKQRMGQPLSLSGNNIGARLLQGATVLHIPDLKDEEAYRLGDPARRAIVDIGGARTTLAVALRKDGILLGSILIYRQEVRPFSERQIALLENFAAQAVIAMENARLLGELQDRTAELVARNSEYGEQIAHQSATIDVLKAMSGSPGDTQPVFDLIARRAREICNGMSVGLFEFDGELVYARAASGGDPVAIATFEAMFPTQPTRGSIACRAILDRQIIHIRNVDAEPDLLQTVRNLGGRSNLSLPLLRDGAAIGAISLNSWETGGFSDSQVELLKTFAEQAVIAITSAETFRQLQDRTAALALRNSEFGERIEQQSATIDVLKVMSSTPDDTQPVFDQIVRRAAELCNGWRVVLLEFDGERVHLRANYRAGEAPAATRASFARYEALFPLVPTREIVACQAILDRRIIHVPDSYAQPDLHPTARDPRRSQLAIPLLLEGRSIGAISLSGDVGGFSDSQVALLQTFAEQAVIAIGSVATYKQLRERTAELTRSVGELRALEEVLRAVNSSLDIDTVLATIISRAVQLSQADEGTIYEFDAAEEVFVPKSAFGMSDERVAALRDRRIRLGETHLGQSAILRAPVHIDDVQTQATPEVREFLSGIHAVLAVPLLRNDTVIGGMVIRRRSPGGFAPSIPTLLQTFAGQAVLAIENAGLFHEASRARAAAEAALADLRRAQDQLVQSQKMASLGQLTAGIAHEIKNPLNFVNNFSDLSADLLDELNEALAPEKLAIAADIRAEIDDLTATLKGNLRKIAEHGRRADSIVKNMLLHSRSGSTERRAMDVNAITEEALNLAYHGARAEIPGFNIMLEKALDPAAGEAEIFPQELIRVLVNLAGNGFYATRKRAQAQPGHEPTLRLATSDLGERVEIRVRDNGTGIPDAIREKIFEPFFTTKPPGEGTGLGLSLSYDIIVKQHGGQLTVDSMADHFTEFVITLPRRPQLAAGPAGAAA